MDNPDLGSLPQWNLGDLYESPTAPGIEGDLDRGAAQAKALAARFRGKLAILSGDDMAEAVKEYEVLQDLLGKVGSYAQLVYAGNMSDPENGRFYQTIQERITDITAEIIFFTLEINRIEEGRLEAMLATPALARYKPWFEAVRAFRLHQLSDEAERLLHDKSVVGRAAWNRLFDETIAGMRVSFEGKEQTLDQVLNLLTDRDCAKRKAAAKAVSGGLTERVATFGLITNTLAKDKEIEDRWRDFARPVSSRNLANQVEDEVVDALVQAVTSAYPRLAHRYYGIKAGWFGSDRLDYWDRNAPLPEDSDRKIPWEEAKQIVLGAYGAFSPDLASIGQRFFDGGWIDAPARPGKAPGAFAHPVTPSAHPYILLNYYGRTRDVMTLAHELGHGMHQVLAGPQGALLADTPLTLAETASVFGEMLTFRALLEREKDPNRRRILIAGKVEDMLNTVVRQIAFHRFETRLHDQRRRSELPAEEIGKIWLETQAESLGPVLRFDDDYRVFWAYIPHFIHSPFYVYAYAFGDCLVNSLYAAYQAKPKGFAKKYLDMLAAGGSKRHKALLAPFGLDAADPKFWDRGLTMIEGLIDELA
jgi:oligoendopeptidase F